MAIRRFFRIAKDLILSFGWIGLSLSISAASLAIVMSMAYGFYLVFKVGLGIDNGFLGSLSLLGSFIIYVMIVGWFAWRYIRRKLQM